MAFAFGRPGCGSRTGSVNGPPLPLNTWTKELAGSLAILPQGPVTPQRVTVVELVKPERYPYQNWLQQWSRSDEDRVRWALEQTAI